VELSRLEAFVLRRIKYGDTSVIATLFTREHGKLSVMAKGARSPKSKRGIAAALEPLNRIEALVYIKPSRNVQTLSNAEILDDTRKIKSDFDRLSAGAEIAMAITTILPEGEPSEAVWKLLTEAVNKLTDIEEAAISSLALAFKAALLTVTGYGPIVESCAICDGELSEACFSPSNGGLVCEKCGGPGISLKPLEVELVKKLFGPIREALDVEIPPKSIGKMRQIIEQHGDFHINRK